MSDVRASEIFNPLDDPSYQARLIEEIERERARREARRRLDAEERGPIPFPQILTLRQRLAQPRDRTEWRIEGWLPIGARMVLAAQWKTGKTTLIGSMVRSLVDADPFLGCARVTPISGSVVIIDTEMSTQQLTDWLEVQGIEQNQLVVPILLRGQVGSFDILDAGVRAQWAGILRTWKAEALILDCFRPVLDALGLDENRDAGRLLVALDALLKEAGISECIVVHHMGHANERSRGDSRLRDWPDVEVRLVRQDENPNSARFISAFGRDVNVEESALTYDPVTHHLTIAGGSRDHAKASSALSAILELLQDETVGLSARAIEAAIFENGEHSRMAVRDGLKQGIQQHVIITKPGPKRAKLHLVRQCAEVRRECASEQASECAAAYIERRTGALNGTRRQFDPANGALDVDDEATV